MFNRLRGSRKGQALAEYAVIIGGVLLMTIVAVSVFGHKVNDLMALSAVILPCAHADDNQPMISGKLIETAVDGGSIGLDIPGVLANSNTERLGNQMGVFGGGGPGTTVSSLVVEAP